METTSSTTNAMTEAEKVRQERGRLLAQRMRITRKAPGLFVVPASSGPGSYIVEQDAAGHDACSCPDYELRQLKCKHAWAVEYSRRSETMADGSAKVVETLRVTYSQEWSSYNAAQTNEGKHVPDLLRALCDGLSEEPQKGKGQRRLHVSDRAFAVAMKVYGGMSTRRNDTMMRSYAENGYLEKAPSWNSVIDYMDDPAMTPILHRLIRESAAPLASVESQIAVDSSGFTTVNYARWFDHKYGRMHEDHVWLKAHCAVGCKTNVITAAKITDGNVNDSPQLPELLTATNERFTPEEVLADLGYHGHPNAHAIVASGATPYIPFKVNSTGTAKKGKMGGASDLWKRMFAYWTFKRTDFLTHYNQRSNVESTFSALKRKFGASLRSKTRTGQENELLAKILCFNLSVLIHEMYELGIVPLFWQDKGANDDAARRNGNVHDGMVPA